MSTMHNDDPLREAPLLSQLKGRDPFVVEQGLFDRMPQEIAARIARKSAPAHPFPWSRTVAVALPLAALVIGAWFLLRSPADPTLTADTVVAFEDPSLGDMLLMEDADTYTELALTDMDLEPTSFLPEGLTEDELVDYFDRSGSDITELLISL